MKTQVTKITQNTKQNDRPFGPTAVLRASCPDRKGILARLTAFVADRGGNIIDLDQHVDAQESVFFSRVEWELETFQLGRGEIHAAFQELADEYRMSWAIEFSDEVSRVAIFGTTEQHCIYDLLARYRDREFPCEIPILVANRPDLAQVAEQFGLEFHCVPYAELGREEAEARQMELMEEHKIDTVVLAKYMRIFSADFVERFPNRIINIHHSFLPAFPGGRPYHSAFARGVKIIGATSHYVTSDLDAGPIIDQDVTRVSHRDTISEMKRKGRDLEKVVLARALYYHLTRRTWIYNNKTVVFE